MARVAIEIAPANGGDDEGREIGVEEWRHLNGEQLAATRVVRVVLVLPDGTRHPLPQREAWYLRVGARRTPSGNWPTVEIP